MKETTDYDLFRSINSNREVDKRHLKKLVEAIKKKNLLHLSPIMCNKNFEVIDGQHRLEAARQLGVPIFYVIDEKISKADIASINSQSKNWSQIDYINFWTVEKAPGFDRLSAFISEYPYIKTSTALNLLSKSGVRNTKSLQEGKVDVDNYEFAVDVAKLLIWFRNIYEHTYERGFIMAVAKLMKHSEFNLKTLHEKVSGQPRSLVRCVDTKQYTDMLLEIYNYRRPTKITL